MTGEAVATNYKQVVKLMGNRFEFTVQGEDEAVAQSHIDAAIGEVQRIEKLLTTFSEESQTAVVNRQAGIAPVEVDKEVFGLIKRSLAISSVTQGAFDISYGSIDKRFWNFDQQMTALPSKEAAREAVKLINYKNILLDEDRQTVFLKQKGMRIGFGGIGKGYAAERAKQVLLQLGVESGVVNASGDLAAWGLQPNGKPWTVGIASPDSMRYPFSSVAISGRAVATSGNYEKFVTIGGRIYSHTIDPRTGFPVHGIKSVTIICPNAELADALTTPVMVMGVKAGLNLVNQLKDIACIIIDENNRLFTSHNIHLT
jgi:thiamine biosynthesis lipoprotein